MFSFVYFKDTQCGNSCFGLTMTMIHMLTEFVLDEDFMFSLDACSC